MTGRTLALDGKPIIHLEILRDPDSRYAISPVEADALAHYVAKRIDWNEFLEFMEEYKKA